MGAESILLAAVGTTQFGVAMLLHAARRPWAAWALTVGGILTLLESILVLIRGA